jgi:hypothetical protein
MENVNKKNTLVEDDLNLVVFKRLFNAKWFDVTLAKNGMEGFESSKGYVWLVYSGCNDAV